MGKFARATTFDQGFKPMIEDLRNIGMDEIGEYVEDYLNAGIALGVSVDEETKAGLRVAAKALAESIEAMCPVALTTRMDIAYGPNVEENDIIIATATSSNISIGGCIKVQDMPDDDWSLLAAFKGNPTLADANPAGLWMILIKMMENEEDEQHEAAVNTLFLRRGAEGPQMLGNLKHDCMEISKSTFTPMIATVLHAKSGGGVAAVTIVIILPPSINYQLDCFNEHVAANLH